MPHRSSLRRTAIRLFARLTRFSETFVPVTPLPDGSGVTTGTLGPQDTTAWAFASSYQRTFSDRLLNELRIGDTRRSVGRAAAAARRAASARSAARHPVDGAVSRHAADVSDRRLSAARIAAEHGDRFRHERDADRGHADVGHRPPHGQGRRGPAVGASERDAAAVADRLVHVQQPVHRSARRRNTGTPLASFLLGQVQQFSIDLQQERDPQPRALPGVLRPGRLAVSDRLTVNAGVRYTLNFPVDRGEQPGRGLQPRHRSSSSTWGGTASRAPPASCTSRTSARGSASSARVTDTTVVRAGYGAGLDRAGRHHDAVHDAGVSVPADGLAAHARQHRAGLHAGERAARRADSADAGRRARPGRVRRRSRPRLGLRAAVECVVAARARRPTSRWRWPTSARRSRASAFPTRTSIS